MTAPTFDARVISFFNTLRPPRGLPEHISALNPYHDGETRKTVKTFYQKYFNDTHKRVFIIGINPGRLGAGITGIAFTDSPALQQCGIPNNVPKTKELSAAFVYQCIDAYGGPDVFYKNFFLTSVCPVGFTSGGKNFNYYDSVSFMRSVTPYIVQTLKQQIGFGAGAVALILGCGKNYRMMEEINNTHAFFKHIIPLEHPRFIMQYRRKQVKEYINRYLQCFKEVGGKIS